MRGEWIEILNGIKKELDAIKSLPMRGEWIEILIGFAILENT